MYITKSGVIVVITVGLIGCGWVDATGRQDGNPEPIAQIEEVELPVQDMSEAEVDTQSNDTQDSNDQGLNTDMLPDVGDTHDSSWIDVNNSAGESNRLIVGDLLQINFTGLNNPGSGSYCAALHRYEIGEYWYLTSLQIDGWGNAYIEFSPEEIGVYKVVVNWRQRECRGSASFVIGGQETFVVYDY
jgi:hypothetical protein